MFWTMNFDIVASNDNKVVKDNVEIDWKNHKSSQIKHNEIFIKSSWKWLKIDNIVRKCDENCLNQRKSCSISSRTLILKLW